MGVRYLTTCARRNDSFWRPLESCERPVLVIDAGSFKFELCYYFGYARCGDLASLSADTWNVLICLQQRGWQMIFVFDGAQPEWKADTWTKRSQANMAKAERIFEGTAGEDDWMPPMLSGSVIKSCLDSAGIRCITADFEGDSAVSALARSCNGVVVANDSDLMIMASEGYIDMKQFFRYALGHERTLWLLHPQKIWEHFQLDTPEDISLWASICGNDFVHHDHEQLLQWHTELKSKSQERCMLRIVAQFVRERRSCGDDPFEYAKTKLPDLHGNLEYSCTQFYVEDFREETSLLTINGRPLTEYLLRRWREGKLPSSLVQAARGQRLEMSTLLEASNAPCAWHLSRRLRAAAARLLPCTVVERVRKDCSNDTVDIVLEAPDLDPPMANWPFGLEGVSKEDCTDYVKQALDWTELTEDCHQLPNNLIFAVACLRFMIRANASADEQFLDISWPYVAALLVQFCMQSWSRQELLRSFGVFDTSAVFCKAGAPFLTAYLTTFSSLQLLNSALKSPLKSTDACSAYDGPFLHTFMACILAPKDAFRPPGFELNDDGCTEVHIKKLPGWVDLDLFRSLASLLERSILGLARQPILGHLNLDELTFSMSQFAPASI